MSHRIIPSLTERERQTLAETLNMLDDVEHTTRKQRAEICKPFDENLNVISRMREMVVERFGLQGVATLTSCSVCARVLFDGDEVHDDVNGGTLCQEHAPTHGEILWAYCELVSTGQVNMTDLADVQDLAVRHTIAHHFIALSLGYSLDDKITHPL